MQIDTLEPAQHIIKQFKIGFKQYDPQVQLLFGGAHLSFDFLLAVASINGKFHHPLYPQVCNNSSVLGDKHFSGVSEVSVLCFLECLPKK